MLSIPPKFDWRAISNDFSTDAAKACIAAIGKDHPMPGGAKSAQPATLGSVQPGSGGCTIKGNIGKSGKIYHVPGSPSYASTKRDESRGGRRSRSGAEAGAAGRRAPRERECRSSLRLDRSVPNSCR